MVNRNERSDLIKMNLQRHSDGGEGAGGEGGTGGGQGSGAGTGSGDGGAGGAKVYSQEYVQALRSESAGYRTQLREAQQQLATIKKELGFKETDEVSDWKKVLSDLKTTNEAAVTQASENAKKLLLKAEVKAQAADLNIVDADAALALADLSEVEIDDDGTVKGVKEALEALATDKPYLKKAQTPSKSGSEFNGGGGGEVNPWADDQFNLTEQARIMKADPERAKQLKAAAGK